MKLVFRASLRAINIVFFSLLFAPKIFAYIQVTDGIGNKVTLSHSATRIISLSPNLTEILCEIGAERQIIARDKNSDYPSSIKKIPILADYFNINLEHLLAIRPDLIVIEQSLVYNNKISQLKKMGLAVYVNRANHLDDVFKTMDDLGELTGNSRIAQQKIVSFQQHLHNLTLLKLKHSDYKVRVFYELWDRPLMTMSNNSIIGELISRCGGENIFANLSTSSPHVSIEAVIKCQPDIIVISDLKFRKTWSLLPKTTKIIFIPPDLIQRTGPRLVQGMDSLCQNIAKIRTAY